MKVRGEFTEFSGGGQIEDARTVSGRIDVKAASVHTGLGRRDEDLRSPEGNMFGMVGAKTVLNVSLVFRHGS